MARETGSVAPDLEARPVAGHDGPVLHEAMRLSDGDAIAYLEDAVDAYCHSSGRSVDDLGLLLEALVLRLAAARRWDQALARYRALASRSRDPARLAAVQAVLLPTLMDVDHPGVAEVARAYVANPSCSRPLLVRILAWSIGGSDQGHLVRRLAAEGARPFVEDPVVALLFRLGVYQRARLSMDQADALIATLDPAALEPWTRLKAVCHLVRARAFAIQGRPERAIEETSAAAECEPGELGTALHHLAALSRVGHAGDLAAWCRGRAALLPDGHPVRVTAEFMASPGVETADGLVSLLEGEDCLPAGACRDLLLDALGAALLPRFTDRPGDLEARGTLAERLEEAVGPLAWTAPVAAARALARMQAPPPGALAATRGPVPDGTVPLSVLAGIGAIAAGEPTALGKVIEGARETGDLDDEIAAFFSGVQAFMRRLLGDAENGASPAVPDRLLFPFPWLSRIDGVCRDLAAWLEERPAHAHASEYPVDGWTGLAGWLLTVGASGLDPAAAEAERLLDASVEPSVLFTVIAWIEQHSGLLPRELVAKACEVLAADPRLAGLTEAGTSRECRSLRLALLGEPPEGGGGDLGTPRPGAGDEEDLLSQLAVRLVAADRAYLEGRRRIRLGDPSGALDWLGHGNPVTPLDRLVDSLYAPARAYWSMVALAEAGRAEEAGSMLPAIRGGPFTAEAAVLCALRALRRGDAGPARALAETGGTAAAHEYLRALLATGEPPEAGAPGAVAACCLRHDPPHHRYEALLWSLNGRVHERRGEYGVAAEAYGRALRYGLDGPAHVRGILRCAVERLRRGELFDPVRLPSLPSDGPGNDGPCRAVVDALRADPSVSGSGLAWLRASALLARGLAEEACRSLAGIPSDIAEGTPIAAFREAVLARRAVAESLASGPPAVRIEPGETPAPAYAGTPPARFWRRLGAMRWLPGRVVTPDTAVTDEIDETLPHPYRAVDALLRGPGDSGGEGPEWSSLRRYLAGPDQVLPAPADCPPLLDRGTVVAELIHAYLRVGTTDPERERCLIEAGEGLAPAHAACREALVLLLLSRACAPAVDPAHALEACERAASLMDPRETGI